jgi:hypothetical protein
VRTRLDYTWAATLTVGLLRGFSVRKAGCDEIIGTDGSFVPRSFKTREMKADDTQRGTCLVCKRLPNESAGCAVNKKPKTWREHFDLGHDDVVPLGGNYDTSSSLNPSIFKH